MDETYPSAASVRRFATILGYDSNVLGQLSRLFSSYAALSRVEVGVITPPHYISPNLAFMGMYRQIPNKVFLPSWGIPVETFEDFASMLTDPTRNQGIDALSELNLDLINGFMRVLHALNLPELYKPL